MWQFRYKAHFVHIYEILNHAMQVSWQHLIALLTKHVFALLVCAWANSVKSLNIALQVKAQVVLTQNMQTMNGNGSRTTKTMQNFSILICFSLHLAFFGVFFFSTTLVFMTVWNSQWQVFISCSFLKDCWWRSLIKQDVDLKCSLLTSR